MNTLTEGTFVKIVFTNGTWGSWDCQLDNGSEVIDVGYAETRIHLDREQLLLKALALAGVEVVTKTHWNVNGVLIEKEFSNLD